MEKEFNTDINIVGSISNYDIIFEIIKMNADKQSDEEIIEKVVNKNIFEIRTKESRGRFLRVIKKEFLDFKTPEQKSFIFSIAKSAQSKHIQNIVLYFHFALNNKLFRMVTTNLFRKKLLQGTPYFTKYDVEDFIFELADSEGFLKNLPESTIKTVARKYLSIMTKLGYLEGSKKKKFVYRIPDMKDMLFTIYLLESIGASPDEIFSHELMDLWLIEDPLKEEILKNAAIKNLIEYTSTGKTVKIKCNLSMEDTINAITE